MLILHDPPVLGNAPWLQTGGYTERFNVGIRKRAPSFALEPGGIRGLRGCLIPRRGCHGLFEAKRCEPSKGEPSYFTGPRASGHHPEKHVSINCLVSACAAVEVSYSPPVVMESAPVLPDRRL